ncbi:MAG: hypothetical protein IH969_01835, partial [Candidatus Krumholzibacteriota bacterium]|nr:hypothetical protein [Candidatus Krumholzibacteriota bacterium]
MRFPSLQNLRTDAHESAARFPFVILAAFVAAVAGVLFVEASNNDEWAKLYLGAQLGVPFMFAIAVAGEVRAWARSLRTGLSAGAIIALTAYAWALPGDITAVAGTRHAQFTVGLHLLVAFAPFLGAGRINGFWQYNRVLFLRFCMAILYSAVLFFGEQMEEREPILRARIKV